MKAVVIGVLAAVVVGSAAYAQAPDVSAGKKAYTDQKCATCHQIAGVGSKAGSVLDGVGGKLSAADIKTWLTDPASMEAKLPKKPAMTMSAYMKTHKLADADVASLVAYMQSLK